MRERGVDWDQEYRAMTLLERIKLKRAEREKQLLKNPLHTKEYKQSYITGASAFNIPYKGMQCDCF